ncbi:Histone chaperone asf1b [Pleodorina starrii]|nr:Histone chaperone asf1b [Pleodorina starrii]
MADLVWRLVYVGSADSDRFDQELENIEVGPVMAGTFKFVLEANPPNPSQIPADDLVGVTVILLTCSYRDKEFIRVGYYVNNDYMDEELRENPPEQPRLDRLQRSILDAHPRVTRYSIPFDEPEPMEGAQPMDEDMGGQQAPGVEQVDAMMAAAAPMAAPVAAFQGQPGVFDGHGQQGPAHEMFQYVPVMGTAP